MVSLGGIVSISGCQITDNQAVGASSPSEPGQAIGGGIAFLTGNMTITDSTISGNLAQGVAGSLVGFAVGGGIATVPTSGTLG